MSQIDQLPEMSDEQLLATCQQLSAQNIALQTAVRSYTERAAKLFALLKQQIARRRGAEAALQRKRNIVKLLQDVAVAANEAHSIDTALQFAIDEICKYMDWPVGLAYVQESNDTGDLIASPIWFCADERFAAFRTSHAEARIAPGGSWLDTVLQRGEAEWHLDAALEAWRLRAAYGLPVLVTEKVVAVLVFYSMDAQKPDADDLDALRNIAIQLGRVVERTRAAALLQDSERRFRAIFDQTFQFIGLLQPDGVLLEANQTALLFGGLRRQDVVGRPFWEARWWTIAPETQERLKIAIAQAASGRFVRYEVDVKGAGDQVATIDFSLKPVFDEDGRVSALIAEGREITQMKEMMQRLRRSEALLSDAQRVAHLGSWEWDIRTNQLTWSDELHRIYGSSPDTFVAAYEGFLAQVHPDDRKEVEQIVNQAYATGQPFEVTHRIIRSDGIVRTLHGRGQPVLDSLGNVVRMVGTGQDITEQKETETQLLEAQRRAREIAELLRTANTSMTQTLDLPTVLEALLDYMAVLAPYDSGSVLLRRGANSLTVQAIRGYMIPFDAYPLRGRWLPFTSFSHLDTVISQQKSLQIDDTANYPGWHPHFQMAGEVRSWLGVPLIVDDEVIGVCALNHQEPHHFTHEHRLLAEALAVQAASAIRNARWFEELRVSQERLRLLAERIVSIQEEERHRVSRELHDEAGQALTALKMSLDLIRTSLPPTLTATAASLAEAIELTDDTMERIRLLAHALRPPALDVMGLSSAVEALCCEVAARTGLTVSYEGCSIPRLADATAISLYRFAQEALTNVIKHANAQHVQVQLRHDAGILYLSVTDDGQGFVVERPQGPHQPSMGLGLIGMKERLTLLGGSLFIESEPENGARLVAAAPLVTAEEERA